MAETIVMVHGVNCGGWCFEPFRAVFEARGFACLAPDLIGHGADKADGTSKLTGIGIADYRAQMRDLVAGLPQKPILLGHSMGAVIAQQLAAEGLAKNSSWRARRRGPEFYPARTRKSSSVRT